ncbi:unnamed protein product [Lota lota]
MAARITVIVVTVSLLHFAEVHSLPPEPYNVKVVSFNMGVVLTWDIPEYSPGDVTYTAQIKGLDVFQTVCNHTEERRCDLGAVPSCLGAFVLRVRAESGAETSDWAEVPHVPAKETIIGPPTVEVEAKVEAEAVEVEVAITDPVLRVSTPLTKCYSKVTYVLKYWRADQPHHVLEKTDVTKNRFRLGLIDAGNSYCVQARVHIPSYRLEGHFSEPICGQSGGSCGHLLEANAKPVNIASIALSQERSDKISLFYEEHSFCEVVFKQGEQCDDTGKVDDSNELTHYCNLLTLSHGSYRNI